MPISSADLTLAAEEIEWSVPALPGRGKAIALSASDAGSEPITTSILRVLADGSVTVMCGSTEIGQGSSTVLAQIAAAEMGVELGRVRLVQSDTAMVSYDRSTGASRTTTLDGPGDPGRGRRRQGPARRLGDDGAGRRRTAGRRTAWRRTHRIGRPRLGRDHPGVVRWGRRASASGAATSDGSGATEEMPPFWEIGCVGCRGQRRRGDRRDHGSSAS